MLQLDTPILATYGVLTLALACLWLPENRRFPMLTQHSWLFLLLGAILLGLHYGFLQPLALLSIAAFGLACFVWFRTAASRLLKWLSGAMILAFAVAFFLHVAPGFANPKVLSGLKLSADAIPYDKFFDFDTVMVSLGILGFGHRRLSGTAEWSAMLRLAAPITLATLLAVMLLSLLLDYVNWQPKWTPLFVIWAWGNLFFTCCAEEAFFRGFIQKNLISGLANTRGGTVIALLITSSLFGLAHIAGGISYVFLATVAGIGYGCSYLTTRSTSKHRY